MLHLIEVLTTSVWWIISVIGACALALPFGLGLIPLVLFWLWITGSMRRDKK